MWQYYHALYFPELQPPSDSADSENVESVDDDLRPRILKDFHTIAFNATRRKQLRQIGLDTCVIDFAWLGPGKVQVIEVNPFDPVNGIGTSPGSMGSLFRWDDGSDRRIITGETKTSTCASEDSKISGERLLNDVFDGVHFRVQRNLMTEREMKMKLNREFRDVIFPSWEERAKLKGKLAPTGTGTTGTKGSLGSGLVGKGAGLKGKGKSSIKGTTETSSES